MAITLPREHRCGYKLDAVLWTEYDIRYWVFYAAEESDVNNYRWLQDTCPRCYEKITEDSMDKPLPPARISQ